MLSAMARIILPLLVGIATLITVTQVPGLEKVTIFGILALLGTGIYSIFTGVPRALKGHIKKENEIEAASGFVMVDHVKCYELSEVFHPKFNELLKAAWGTEAGSPAHVALWDFAKASMQLTDTPQLWVSPTSPVETFEKLKDAYEEMLTDPFTVVNEPLLLDMSAPTTRGFSNCTCTYLMMRMGNTIR